MTSRQYKWALLVLGVAGLAGGALGSWLVPSRAAFVEEEALQVVTAREFQVVDEAGKTRAQLLMREGRPALDLYDKAGKKRAVLALYEDGWPYLDLFDETGIPRAVLALWDGQPALLLWDENGKRRVSLGLLEDGQPRLALLNAAREERATLEVLNNGRSNLSLRGAEGDGQMRLGLAQGQPALDFYDQNGRARVFLDMYEGRPGLTLADAQGNDRAVVGCTSTTNKRTGADTEHPESTITLYKANGDLLWQAP